MTADAAFRGAHSLEGFGFTDDDGPAVQAAGRCSIISVRTQQSSLASHRPADSIPSRNAAGDRPSDAAEFELCETIRDDARDAARCSA